MPVLLLGIVGELLWQFLAEIVLELFVGPILRGTGTLLLHTVSLGRIEVRDDSGLVRAMNDPPGRWVVGTWVATALGLLVWGLAALGIWWWFGRA